MVKIAVLGATGNTGTELVKQALEAGLQVKVLVRNPDKLGDLKNKVEAVKGDATDKENVAQVVEGVDVVVSCLGPTKSMTDVCSKATVNVLAAKPARYVVVSGGGVTLEGDKKSFGNKAVTAMLKLIIGAVVKDKELEASLLQGSNGVDWVLVRPPRLVEGPLKPVKHDLFNGPGMSITFASLASFLLQVVKDNKFVKQAPFVSN